MIKAMILAAAALTMSATSADAQTMIEKNNLIRLEMKGSIG